MKAYLDLIFLVNTLYDALILCSVSILLKRNVSPYSIFKGVLLGMSSMCFLFLSVDRFVLILFKLITSLGMVVLTFGHKNIKDNLFYFYVITIILGGGQYLLTGNEYQVNIISMVVISPIIMFLYIKSQKKYKLEYTKHHSVIIIDGNNTYHLTGYMDTGNNLLDPITKLPVIILNKKIEFLSNKYFYVPYHVVGGKNIIKCTMVDKVLIDSKVIKVLIGLNETGIHREDCEIILNEHLREKLC